MVKIKEISPEDSALFRKSVGTINKLKQDAAADLKNPTRKKPVIPVEQGHPAYDDSDIPDTLTIGMGDLLSFRRPGVQHRIINRLKKGQIPIDRELDLHGLTGTESKKRLKSFLADCKEDGIRAIRIIHGKGHGSSNNKPVIKNIVNNYLRADKNVLAFNSAPKNDGGTGAVYVLLMINS